MNGNFWVEWPPFWDRTLFQSSQSGGLCALCQIQQKSEHGMPLSMTPTVPTHLICLLDLDISTYRFTVVVFLILSVSKNPLGSHSIILGNLIRQSPQEIVTN